MRVFVLDEADDLLSRGFEKQVYDIFRMLQEDVQVIRTKHFLINRSRLFRIDLFSSDQLVKVSI